MPKNKNNSNNSKKNKKPSLKKEKKPRKVKIFAIVDIVNRKLVSVGLNEEDVWFEYDLGLYDEDKYKVAKLEYII